MNCSSFAPATTLHICQFLLPSKRKGFGNATRGCLWTCTEVAYYCTTYLQYTMAIGNIGGVLYNFAQLYCLIIPGFVSNCLFFLTLLSPTLSGSTFLFLRIIALIQVCGGILAILDQFTLSIGGNFLGIGRLIIETLINASKLLVCSLSFFLTLDRFLAVCVPSIFSKLSARKFLGLSFGISFLIVCLELENLTERNIISYDEFNVTGLMYTTNAWGKLNVHRVYMANMVMVIKLLIFISLVVFGSAIVFRLRQRGRQVADMMSADQAKKEHQEMIGLCRFQMLDTVLMALDVCIALSTSLGMIVSSYARDYCSYNDAIYDYYLSCASSGLGYISEIFQSFAHGELFFLYLIFFAKFRRAAVDLLKMVFAKSVAAFLNTKSGIGSLMYG